MNGRNSLQLSGGSAGVYPSLFHTNQGPRIPTFWSFSAGSCQNPFISPLFWAGNSFAHPSGPVANGKKENRKWLLSWCCDQAINKVVHEFVRTKSRCGDCGRGFHLGRATRPEFRGTKSRHGDTLFTGGLP